MEESLAALRQTLPGHFEKAPNRPVYLRQIRQLLRAAGTSIDERSGFRGLLDLLHQAQREGWVRLHRDRKGVWRVFPAAGAAPAMAPATPAEVAVEAGVPLDLGPELDPGLEQELEQDFLMPVETDVNWEAAELMEETPELSEEIPAPAQAISEPPEKIPVAEAPPPPAPIEEAVAAPAEPAPHPKGRKPRAPKAGAKTAKRKAPAKRKAREPGKIGRLGDPVIG
jgi:hypothetical protein